LCIYIYIYIYIKVIPLSLSELKIPLKNSTKQSLEHLERTKMKEMNFASV
jgi:hypothetical protein